MRSRYPQSDVRQIGHESEVVDSPSKSATPATSGARLVDQLMRFRPDDMSANGWAVRAGVSRTIWADMRRHGNPSRRTLEKLLGAAGSSLAEFEALRVTPPTAEISTEAGDMQDRRWGWRGPPLTPIPVVGCADHGAWDGGPLGSWQIRHDRVERLIPRPPGLAADGSAFALLPPGDAMAPRFRPDRLIVMSPMMSVALGEEVLVQMAGDSASSYAAIPGKLLSLERGSIRITQPRARAEASIERPLVRAIIVIAGEYL